MGAEFCGVEQLSTALAQQFFEKAVAVVEVAIVGDDVEDKGAPNGEQGEGRRLRYRWGVGPIARIAGAEPDRAALLFQVGPFYISTPRLKRFT